VEHIHDGRVYSGSVVYTRRSCPYYAGTTVVSVTYTTVVYTTVVSIVDLWSIHDGRVRSMQARRSCP